MPSNEFIHVAAQSKDAVRASSRMVAGQPADLPAALAEAFACKGPAIVDRVVVPDEMMPNMPHVELEQVGNYALAKIKEAIHAVTGG